MLNIVLTMAYGSKGYDIEAGMGQLYPNMMEDPQLRWGFIRKVYIILCMQMLLTVIVAAAVVLIEPIHHFILYTRAGLATYICIVILTFISTFFFIFFFIFILLINCLPLYIICCRCI